MHREAIRNARDDDTRLTRAYSGRPARARNNRYMDAAVRERAPLPEFPLMSGYAGAINQAAQAAADPEIAFLLYGQAAALNREKGAAELVETLVAEAQAILGPI